MKNRAETTSSERERGGDIFFEFDAKEALLPDRTASAADAARFFSPPKKTDSLNVFFARAQFFFICAYGDVQAVNSRFWISHFFATNFKKKSCKKACTHAPGRATQNHVALSVPYELVQ